MGHHLIQLPHLLLTFCVLACPLASGLFEWLRNPQPSPAAAPPSPPPPVAPAHLSKDAQFEMMISDEKFLSEAKQLELGPLGSCHNKVVSRLKSSCESLSEENLAKLGVELFNCQAEIEGRLTFPCTEEMSIKECTSDMNPDTWNAYHIVSNRARSVCYATRQQLFRRRAELTVNALISTATSQLEAMKDLKEGQLELKDLTAASLDKLVDGHGVLQAQQGKLHKGQEQMETSLRENLERLSQEKALIASGQQVVAQLIQGITKQMENVSEHLQEQSAEVQDGHKAIANDLADVRLQAQDIYQKIDESMSEFLQYQDQTSQYYAELMHKLERMNSTLGVLLDYLDNMQTKFEERLHTIQGYLSWTGLSLTAMWTCVVHTSYFLLCAVLLMSLRSSAFSWALLLLVVPLNAAAEVNQQPALDLTSLSLLLLTTSLGYGLLSQLWTSVQNRGKPVAMAPLSSSYIIEPHNEMVPSGHSYPQSSTPQRDVKDGVTEQDWSHDSFLSGDLGLSTVAPQRRSESESKFVPIFGSLDDSTARLRPPAVFSQAPIDDVPLINLGRASDVLNDSQEFGTTLRSTSPAPSLITNSSSLSGCQLCSGITKTGKACKKRAVLGQEFCRVHEREVASYVHS